ncbi:KEOPS complex subunit Pcc1 [Staphylothermus hellenicus]|uniref:Uncharacterized protein n=1 Tax=Staphylothermus hellenicus (strain DSM 12710 / JCM 10830 / BK20S6-10-b1 / P8) TaxID=591019 RepID=D7DAB3_STAHD|nr:KEOPS complex subunit Pcc1 [Staphylothermus hellenicus]ADI32709.1 hypothetical protein Shell_1624 [Staphylothermus hellenicus DSM 12710]
MAILSKLKIIVEDEKLAEAIYEMLYPDNLTAPKYMSLKERILKSDEGYIYEVEISVPNDPMRFDSLRGTLDEILSITEMINNVSITLK